MIRGQRWWILAGLSLGGAACGVRAGDGVAFPAAEKSITLNFVNEIGVPLKVYAVESGTTNRVGTIYGQGGRLSLRSNREGMDSVQVIIEPLGEQRRIRTGQLVVVAGAALDFTISRPLASSTAEIRE